MGQRCGHRERYAYFWHFSTASRNRSIPQTNVFLLQMKRARSSAVRVLLNGRAESGPQPSRLHHFFLCHHNLKTRHFFTVHSKKNDNGVKLTTVKSIRYKHYCLFGQNFGGSLFYDTNTFIFNTVSTGTSLKAQECKNKPQRRPSIICGERLALLMCNKLWSS